MIGSDLISILWKVFFIVWPPAFILAAIKFLPSLTSKLILTGVEQQNRRTLTRYKDELDRSTALAIERNKGAIQSEHAALKARLDFVSASHSTLREHTITAVQVLWRQILYLRDLHTDMATFESMFLDTEIATALLTGSPEPVLGWVAFYRDEEAMRARALALSASEIEEHRPFAGDKLWLIFVVLRSVYLRAAYLMNRAVAKRVYVRMLDDDGIRQLLSDVVPDAAVASARKDRHRGFNTMLGRLEAMFLEEAARVMSGSEAFANSLSDLQAGLIVRDKMDGVTLDEAKF